MPKFAASSSSRASAGEGAVGAVKLEPAGAAQITFAAPASALSVSCSVTARANSGRMQLRGLDQPLRPRSGAEGQSQGATFGKNAR